MENKENAVYKELLEKLKSLIDGNKNIKEIQEFLSDLDLIMSNMSVKVFDEDFLLPFYSLLETKTEKSTIGEVLFNQYLSNHKELSPSLLVYFYLKQKDNFGFKDIYNKFKIATSGAASTYHYDDKNIEFNFQYYWKNYGEADEFNYMCMENIIHEIVHIYQFSISPNSEDMYERLIYNDRRIWELSIDSGILNYGYLHDEYLIEHHANIWSKHFMICFAKNNPSYFNGILLKAKQEEFMKKVNRNADYGNQRNAFSKLMSIALEYRFHFDTEEEKQVIEINKHKFKELLQNDMYLREYIFFHSDMQDAIQQVYLGIGSSDFEIIQKNAFSPKKGIR